MSLDSNRSSEPDYTVDPYYPTDDWRRDPRAGPARNFEEGIEGPAQVSHNKAPNVPSSDTEMITKAHHGVGSPICVLCVIGECPTTAC